MELQERIQLVNTKADLAHFVDALRSDLADHPSEWENPTLERFLEAMAAWMKDMDGFYQNAGKVPPDSPTWKTFAEILIASKMYE